MNVEPGRDLSVGMASFPAVRQQQPVPERIRTLSTMTDSDYVDLFTMSGGQTNSSPDQWARVLFEDVAGRAGQFIWRALLGLRLTASPDRVAGWRIAGRGDDWIRLEACSWHLTGHLVVQADDERVSLATFIRYDRPVASRIWPPLARWHRKLAPDLLRDAHRRISPRSTRTDE
ncbi:hypothetical protein ABZ532_24600 [Streptomyces sp. NPDC019396]|uniref:hypothetical protein n=1 Tax=Streptomyces sp. NPDC019396 TaxID=3154687 RepID=UPI0033D95734